MHPSQTLQLPARDPLGTLTPSGLTPNTRSEAEAALSHNTSAQTDSAAPTTPLGHDESLTAAQAASRRTPGTISTSSTNYEAALREAHKQASASSELSTASNDAATKMEGLSLGEKVDSPVSVGVDMDFPLPGQGVVPRHTSIGSGQLEIVRKAKPSGLMLGDLGRQQSWSSQDMKHVMQGALMSSEVGKVDAGYGSVRE